MSTLGERQRHAAVGPLVELHEHEVPDLEPARARLASGRARSAGPRRTARPRSKWISLHGPHGPVSAIRQKLLSSPASTSPQRAIRSGGRPISSRQIVPGDLVVRVGRRGQPLAGDAEVAGQEVPGPVDRLALEVVAEAPVAEHLEEGVVARRPADLLEVVVLAGDAQAALVVDRPRVRARLGADQDVLELDHARVGEQQRRVAGRARGWRWARPCGRARRRTRRTGGGSRRQATPRSADLGSERVAASDAMVPNRRPSAG